MVDIICIKKSRISIGFENCIVHTKDPLTSLSDQMRDSIRVLNDKGCFIIIALRLQKLKSTTISNAYISLILDVPWRDPNMDAMSQEYLCSA